MLSQAKRQRLTVERIDIRDVRREQLVKATILSIVRRGFSRTTLAEIAAHAKLSHGIVSFHFKNKDELLLETLRYLFSEFDEYLAASIERAGPSPVAKLKALVDVDFDPAVVNREKVTVWYAFWGETRWRTDFLELCVAWSKQYTRLVQSLAQGVIDSGGYDRLDAAVVARGLISMLDGCWMDILVNGDKSTSVARKSIQLYLGSIFPKEFGISQRK